MLAIDMSPCRGNPNPPIRGDVAGFSKASRKRMIRTCARLGSAIPIFVTLTYPKVWPSDPAQWKRDLDTWWKRVRRYNGNLSAIWRLEPQERGAPHYHLLIYQQDGKRPFLPHAWVSDSWAKITQGNPDSCSRVEALKSHRGGMFYAAKYCAKLGDNSTHEGWESVGKHWGKLSAKDLPFPAQYEMIMHSGLEQKAVMFSMRDAYKAAFISALAGKYQDAQTDLSAAEYIAEKDWEAMKEDNEFFGNTAAFFGSGEDFLDRLSAKTMELEIRMAALTGRGISTIRRKVDRELARL